MSYERDRSYVNEVEFKSNNFLLYEKNLIKEENEKARHFLF